MCAYTQPGAQLCASESEHKPPRPFWRESRVAENRPVEQVYVLPHRCQQACSAQAVKNNDPELKSSVMILDLNFFQFLRYDHFSELWHGFPQENFEKKFIKKMASFYAVIFYHQLYPAKTHIHEKFHLNIQAFTQVMTIFRFFI